MTRPLRIAYQGAWYHVMNRGLAHNPIFIHDSHRQIFLELLFEIHARYQVEIHAYCLMDNHYHLLIKTPLGNISRVMRHLDGIYTQRFNKSVKRDGPLFRGRYKSILIEADEYLLQLSRYIHLNPVKAKLVKKPEQFAWSSYQAYLYDISPHWLNRTDTLSYFGISMQKEKYQLFVEDGMDGKMDHFYKKIKNIPILGTEDFARKIAEKYLKEQHKIDEIPEHKLLLIDKSSSIENIVYCVAQFYRIDEHDITLIKKRKGNQPRAIAMYLANTIGQYSLPQISLYFSNITSSGVSRACGRLHAKIKNNYKLKLEIEMLGKTIMSIVQT